MTQVKHNSRLRHVNSRTKLLLTIALAVLFTLSPISVKPAAAQSSVQRAGALVSPTRSACGGRNPGLAALEYGSLLRPLATNAAIDLSLPGIFPLITVGSCTCGYVDGRFTQVTIPFSGSSATEQQAWNPVLADYDNISCDGLTAATDEDAYVQSTGRDLGSFAVSWDTNYYYGYTIRGGSSTNKNIFFYYADTNNDGRMSTGEPVLVATWQGSNQSVDIVRYDYLAQNTGGDTLVYTGQPITWNNGKPHTLGSADGYTMPGYITYVGPVASDSMGFGFNTGDRMEWRVRWSDLDLSGPTAIRWHISSANSTNIPGQIDDNMGGCGACAGSTQYGGVSMTRTSTVTAPSGGVTYLPHTVQNTGNGNDVFELTGSYVGAWAPYAYQFYKDVNGDGVYNTGDTLLADSDADGVPDTGPLAPGASINILVAVTLPGTALGQSTITTTATSNFVQCNNPKAFKSVYDSVTATAATLSGFVYSDVNHSATRETTGENGIGVILYAKLAPATGNASQAVPVDTVTGSYSFVLPAAGNYRIIIDGNNTLTDTTPWVPTANWTPTENASGIINVTVGATAIWDQNFGFYNGVKVTGTVFRDDGASGVGTANDGVQQASEAALQNIVITATNGAATTYGTATTDPAGAYMLWIPAGATTVVVTETVPSTNVGIKAVAGNTGGTTPNTYTVTFTDSGIQYTGVNFAMVPKNSFGSNTQSAGNPGAYVYYPHTLQTGSGGQLRFTTSASTSPVFAGFTQVIYRDTNCNSVIDAGENVDISGQMTVVTSGATICIIVGDFIPAGAPVGTQNVITVSAQHNYLPSTVSATQTVTDTSTVTGTALSLSKTVDQANAAPGVDLTYTITYKNTSTSVITSLFVMDTTPIYTRFRSAGCTLPLPANVTACALSAPAVNGTGNIQWTMSGSLAPGASGTLTFVVQIAN